MRLENSIKNASAAIMGKALELILTYFSRIIVIHFLGIEYLGINGLFSNILYLLSSAELGINYALIYAMYKPMATEDHAKLAGITHFYKKVYRIIGAVIFIAGLCFAPFLRIVIAGDSSNIKYLHVLYLFSLINATLPYFVASSKSLISVAQKDYLLSFLDSIYKIIQILLQIIILIISRNYVLFVSIQMGITALKCINITQIAERKYTFLKVYKHAQILKDEKKGIIANVKALIIANLSGVIFSGTDNIIISSFIGLAAVGIFSNYMMIINSLNSIITLGVNSITSSLGNLVALSDAKTIYKRYRQVLMLTFFASNICCNICIIVIKDFIALSFGNQLTLHQVTASMITFNFYLMCIRRPTLLFRNVQGLFQPDKYKGVIECALNLSISLVLVKKIGILGVILGSVISVLCVSIWLEPWVLFHYGFEKRFRNYWSYSIPFYLQGLISYFLSFICLRHMDGFSWLNILIKIFTCLVITITLFIIFFRKTNEFKDIYNMGLGIWKKNKKKGERNRI